MEGSCANEGGGWSPVVVSLSIVILLVLSGLPTVSSEDDTRGEELAILRVGQLDKMRTRNPLPYIADNVWTADVLDRVYDTVGKILPGSGALAPYIVKGVDANDDGVFEMDEYGVFSKDDGRDQLNITAYYDFNGVYFHDGVQATVADLLFSYHLQALNPRMRTNLLSLMDMAGRSGSNHTTTRWLFVIPATKNWENEPAVGNPSLRVAVKFSLQEPYVLFYQKTLVGCVLYPRHVWEGTGWRLEGDVIMSPLHLDFGQAIYPESDSRFGQGIPTIDPLHFIYNKPETPDADSAEEWLLSDEDVIGSGPFVFKQSDETAGQAYVIRNTLYFDGSDAKTGLVFDTSVNDYIHRPYIDGVHFRRYSSLISMARGLEVGEIDYIHYLIPLPYYQHLMLFPTIRPWLGSLYDYRHVEYNLRRQSFGYYNWGQPNEFDVGLHFRKAIAHIIDRATIVKNLLSNYGEIGIIPVNPVNSKYYNTSLPNYTYNLTEARHEIDLAHQDALNLKVQLGSSAPADIDDWYTYTNDTPPKLILPGIGTSEFNLGCQGMVLTSEWIPCHLIHLAMMELGIQVNLVSYDPNRPGSIVPPEQPDIRILRNYAPPSGELDYLYDYFHSSNTASGKNKAGFRNLNIDQLLEMARQEMNESRRIGQYKQVQAILWNKLPWDVICWQMSMEATSTRFRGWIQDFGTIWNYWSLIHLQKMPTKNMSLTIEIQSAMISGGTEELMVTVKDFNGNLLNSADVKLEVFPDSSGTFSYLGGPRTSNYTGKTTNGRLLVNYHAPPVDDVSNVFILVTVTHTMYLDVVRSIEVTIIPAQVKFLSVAIRYVDLDIVVAGGKVRFGTEVKTNEGFQKNEANVTASLEPLLAPPYGLSQTNGTAATMAVIEFAAPKSSNLTSDETIFVITVTASSSGYLDGVINTGFVVIKRYKTCADGTSIPDDLACLEPHYSTPMIILIFTYSVFSILLIIAIARALRRKRKTEPPPSNPRKE